MARYGARGLLIRLIILLALAYVLVAILFANEKRRNRGADSVVREYEGTKPKLSFPEKKEAEQGKINSKFLREENEQKEDIKEENEKVDIKEENDQKQAEQRKIYSKVLEKDRAQSTSRRKSSPDTIAQLEPSWKFIHGKEGDRDAMIEFRHLCVHDNQLVYTDSKIPQPPAINGGASHITTDPLIHVNMKTFDENREQRIEYVPEERPLFVIGQVWGYHLSHFFFNNFMPLVNVMNHYYGSTTSWRTSQRDLYPGNNLFDAKTLNFTHLWMQSPSSSLPVCYERAVIGLNSTCDCCGCLKELPDKIVYEQTRDMVLRTHLNEEEYQQAMEIVNKSSSERQFRMVIVQRMSSRKILNIDQITELLESRGLDHQTVYLEDYSFTDQVRLFSLNATAMLCSHGNAVGNAMWMPPNSLLLEAHSYNQRSQWFEHLYSDGGLEYKEELDSILAGKPCTKSTHGLKLQHFALMCSDPECNDGPSNFNADFRVDVKKLEFILDNLDRLSLKS